MLITKAIDAACQFDHFGNPMAATHQGLHPLQVQHPGLIGDLCRFGHHRVNASLQAGDEGSSNRLGTGSPRDAPDVLQDIAKRLGVQ